MRENKKLNAYQNERLSLCDKVKIGLQTILLALLQPSQR